VNDASGASSVPLNAIEPIETAVALEKFQITSFAATPFRLIDPPENESDAPATLTITVEPAGAVMLIVELE
jgi:hypothetical protein